MKKIIVFLIFFFIVLFVSGEKLASFDNVFKPSQFKIEGDYLYVVDGSVIKLFSMKDYKLITQFGKKGEGPGEFKWRPRIQVFPDQIVALSGGKVSFFSRQGKLKEEKKLPGRFSVYSVKGNYLGSKFKPDIKKMIFETFVKVLDENFNEIKQIYKYRYPEGVMMISASGLNAKQRINLIPDYFNAITDGKYVVIGDSTRGFFFEIFDHKGSKISTINKDYEKVKVSQEFKKKKMDELKRSKNWEQDKKMFDRVFPDYFPAFNYFKVNKGMIYVFKHITKGKERELLILDLKGKIIKKTAVPDKRVFSIFNNKFYYFVDNEDEEVMEFHAIDL